MTTPETITIAYHNHPHDHGGEPVAPLTSAGTPYTYALDQPGRGTITYSTHADGILAHLIGTDYDPTHPTGDNLTHDRDLEHARLRARAAHSYGVIVNHAAAAIASGVAEDLITTLQAAADLHHPLTATTVPTWDHDVPLLLIAAFYQPDGELSAPRGNVILLDTTDPDRYLDDLAQAGVIALSVHSNHTVPAAPTSLDEPSTTADLTEAIATLETLLAGDPKLPTAHQQITDTIARIHTLVTHCPSLVPADITWPETITPRTAAALLKQLTSDATGQEPRP